MVLGQFSQNFKINSKFNNKKYFHGKFSEYFRVLHTIKMIIITDRVAHTKIVAKKAQLELH